ncbi:MAG: ribonuclease HII, partial [Nitrospirota bacterium]
DDSKRLTPVQRDAAYDRIMAGAVAVGVGLADHEEIDRINILQATKRAMAQAIDALRPPPDFLLIDAVAFPSFLPLWALIKGDRRALAVAAASIVAKVTRDRLMARYHEQYPSYNFLIHKGYATPEHLNLLRTFGCCAIHRRSFRPVLQPPRRVFQLAAYGDGGRGEEREHRSPRVSERARASGNVD